MATETKHERPEFATEEHFKFLDGLRRSGATNMFGARPFLLRAYPELTPEQALKVLDYWMHTPRD